MIYGKERTDPWGDAEMFEINGVRCTYSHSEDANLVIHFPGRITLKLAEFEAMKASIKYPAIWRSPIEQIMPRKEIEP